MNEQTDDAKKRIEDFTKEYGELVQKHQVDFVNFPMFQPDGKGHWEVVINSQAVDTKGQPVKSPFIPQ